MPRLSNALITVVVGATLVLSAACAPQSARATASRPAPEQCNGRNILEVQNNLNTDIVILEAKGSALPRMPIAMLGRGWHALEVDQDKEHRYSARIPGTTPGTSRAIGNPDRNVHLALRCRPAA